MNSERPAIFVGLSEPALRYLGRDPLAALEDQEHVTRSIGPNIFLYGKGAHGNLHAVMEFLENSLGWRWYSVYDYLIELCAILKREHPLTMVKTLAYRRSQTQIPPVLPGGSETAGQPHCFVRPDRGLLFRRLDSPGSEDP